MDCESCDCKAKYASELNRLEVLTDLIEFAQQQRAKGSPHTASWADAGSVTKWQIQIGGLRTALPKCAVEDFDNERQRQKEFTSKIIGDYDRSH